MNFTRGEFFVIMSFKRVCIYLMGVLIMKRFGIFILVLVVLFAFAETGVSETRGRVVPIQLALYPPAQIFPEDVSVLGLRLEIYGINDHVSGLDFGLFNRTLGDQKGLQIGGANLVDGHCSGFQFAVANFVGNGFSGWQGGLFNSANGEVAALQMGAMNMGLLNLRGIQIGIINYSRDMSGLQIGLFNAAQVMYGIQIGLVNIISDKETLPVLPFINAAF